MTENMTNEHANVCYTVDRDDIIVDVNDWWDIFANDNNALNLDKVTVLGKPLFHYVSGDVTRMFVVSVFNNVRVKHEQFTQKYRCDSPSLKRYMKMTVIPMGYDSLKIVNEVIAIEPKVYSVNIKAYESRVRRCSMCNRINHEDKWEESDTLIKSGIFKADGEIYVIYTVCMDCRFNPMSNIALTAT